LATTVLLVIAGLFALGALGIAALGRRPLAEELWRLYRLEVGIVGLVLLPAYLGPRTFLVVVTALALAAQGELLAALLPRASGRLRLALAAAAAALVLGAHLVEHSQVWAAPVLLVGALLVADLRTSPRAPPRGRAWRIALALVYPPMFLAYLVRLRDLPEGFLLVAMLYVTIETCDAFALLCGKVAGSTQAFPVLSPGKTVAGIVGGLVIGGAAGLVVGLVATSLGPARVVLATVVALGATLLGDLVASKLKRNLGLKDFGAVVASHGGVLDIYDTVVFAAPLFYGVVAAI
jgi:phosphatidate cytidylyltransferase